MAERTLSDEEEGVTIIQEKGGSKRAVLFLYYSVLVVLWFCIMGAAMTLRVLLLHIFLFYLHCESAARSHVQGEGLRGVECDGSAFVVACGAVGVDAVLENHRLCILLAYE